MEESFEGVGAKKTTSVGGDDDVARAKHQLDGRRTHLDVADLIDWVFD